MSKFKFKLKLQGLELEMEGAKEDIPSIANSLGNHLAGLMQPATEMSGGQVNNRPSNEIRTIDHLEGENAGSRKRKNARTPHLQARKACQKQLNGNMIPPNMAIRNKRGVPPGKLFGCYMLSVKSGP